MRRDAMPLLLLLLLLRCQIVDNGKKSAKIRQNQLLVIALECAGGPNVDRWPFAWE